MRGPKAKTRERPKNDKETTTPYLFNTPRSSVHIGELDDGESHVE
jgi:hypothetical protein